MTAIVHSTPGLIDIRAFTTMGMSAKVTNNPIGMFGTGLKYAIAVLVRAGARPVVWIGNTRYEFFKEPTKFRDKDFDLVRMKRQHWMGNLLGRAFITDLPFTTEYGRNWKMWQAFREIEANTRDEGGQTFALETIPDMWGRESVPDHTTIVIEHPDYVAAYQDRDNIFLPGALKDREGSEGLQVLEGESRSIYYRGMRAMDLNKPTQFTYNVLTTACELTEDRTLKYDFQVKEQIARHLLGSEDADLIKRVLRGGEEYWEHNLPFPEWCPPGEAFREVIERRREAISAGSGHRLWSSAGSYYTRHDRRPVARTEDLLEAHPRPWRLDDDQETILDDDDHPVFARPYGYEGRWGPIAEYLLQRLGFAGDLKDNAQADEED